MGGKGAETMNAWVNNNAGESDQVPPGFRFHPTEEELLHYYLRKKVASKKIDLDVIREVDLNKLEPWDIQEKCGIGSTPQNDWYLFSHKDKKYPTGSRTNRATAAGFWKATGRDKVIYSSKYSTRIGMRKTLVFYKGRAPQGLKSDWIMHEYRLHDNSPTSTPPVTSVGDGDGDGDGDGFINCSEDGWVVCRVFKKKNYPKATMDESSSGDLLLTATSDYHHQYVHATSSSDVDDYDGGNTLDRVLVYMGKSWQQEYRGSPESSNNMMAGGGGAGRFMHLPGLLEQTMVAPENNSISLLKHELEDYCGRPLPQSMMNDGLVLSCTSTTTSADHDQEEIPTQKLGRGRLLISRDWVALDRLVASQLNGQQLWGPQDHFSFPHQLHHHHHHNDHQDHHEAAYPRSTRSHHQQAQDQDSDQSGYYSSSNEEELLGFWSFGPSSSSSSPDHPLRHLSV